MNKEGNRLLQCSETELGDNFHRWLSSPPKSRYCQTGTGPFEGFWKSNKSITEVRPERKINPYP